MFDLTKITPTDRLLTRHEFLTLQAIPPETEWFADIDNPNTRRNYRNGVQEFLRFLGIQSSDELRQVQPAHIIAWRKTFLEATYQPRGKSSPPRKYSHATIRRKLAAVSSLFETLVEKQVMTHNPIKGVKRPTQPSEKTPILPDELMARLLDAPDENTVKGIRDRAMLSAFAHLALRETELVGLRVGSYGMGDGVMQVKVEGKGDKVWYVEVNPGTQRRLEAYFRWINSAQ